MQNLSFCTIFGLKLEFDTQTPNLIYYYCHLRVLQEQFPYITVIKTGEFNPYKSSLFAVSQCIIALTCPCFVVLIISGLFIMIRFLSCLLMYHYVYVVFVLFPKFGMLFMLAKLNCLQYIVI